MASVPYISKPLVEELFISRSSSLNKLEGSWWLRVWFRGRVWLRDRVWLLDSDWWKGRLIIIELLKERLKMSLEIVHCQIKQDNIMTIEQMPVILFKSRDCLAPTLECTVEVVHYRLSHVCNDISYTGWKASSNRLALLL